VAFADIWYLFKPGDEVISHDCRQVRRVVGLSSPGHWVVPPWQKLWNKTETDDDETSVTLHCVHIDFDGKQLGPVSRLFKIRHFDGTRAITSLEVYPVQYAARIDREALIARGRMFFEALSIRHMYYAGPTIEPRDNVDSHVIVDFDMAFNQDHDWVNAWRPAVELLTGESKLLPKVADRECGGLCCRDETICRDDDVEAKRNQDYITSLIPNDRSQRPSLVIHPSTLHDMQSPGSVATVDELVVMSNRVFGFILKSRKWGALPPPRSLPPEIQLRKMTDT
jgi:hypothetical protein